MTDSDLPVSSGCGRTPQLDKPVRDSRVPPIVAWAGAHESAAGVAEASAATCPAVTLGDYRSA